MTLSCPECGHGWEKHDNLIKGAGKMMKPEYNPRGVEDLYECSEYAGMGNWCGCEERSRRPLRQEARRGTVEVMPNWGEWQRGRLVRVTKILNIDRFRTNDKPPPVGSIGEVMYANTINDVPDSIAVQFIDRSWVFPPDHLSLVLVTPEEEQAAIDSIIRGHKEATE